MNRIIASFFADDTALLYKNKTDLDIALRIINKFTEASGLSLNISKSSCLCSETVDCSPLPRANKSERYLGFNISREGLVDHTDNLIKSIKTVAMPQGLSIYGKATTLRAYILSKLWYYLYLLPLTDKLMKHVNEITNLTLWGSRKVCRRNTVRLSQPFETGGLNILDTAIRVKAQHAWIYARCHSHPDLLPIWSQRKSKLAHYFHKEFQYFRLNQGDAVNLKTITLTAIGKPKLTKGHEAD